MFARIVGKKGLVGIAVGALGGGVAYGAWKGRKNGGRMPSTPVGVGVVLARSGRSTPHTRRQVRFEKFASCEMDGQYLMTPADFLESLMHQDLPGWSRKRQLTQKDIENMVYRTPALSKGSSKFFRNLHDKGIITYSEYLFLVTILTKSKRGLEIGYRMLDKDGNQQLSKEEFLVLEEMVNKKSTAKSMEAKSSEKLESSIISDTIPGNTSTLIVHFFTPRGNGQLTFDQFSKFMVDLQIEVSEMEFMEYSRGMPTVPEESFGRLLLRNTALETEQIQQYIDRLNNRLKVRKGITLHQYVDFCLFLNNLDDFAMAMRIYSIAGQPVTQDEFQRAVRISTGHTIDPYVVHTIFQLFDIDGDGKLSYNEFIELMKDRQKRGFRIPVTDKAGWEGFKSCVKKELSLVDSH